MSWFFGKKKQKESTEETSTSNQTDDYVIVERHGNPFDSNVVPTTGNNGGGSHLYPYLDNVMRNPPPLPPPRPSSSSLSPSFEQQQNILGDTQTYLSLIQFQLSKQFNNDCEIDRIHIDEILSYMLRIKNEDYDYDFGLEKSVITEMEATAE